MHLEDSIMRIFDGRSFVISCTVNKEAGIQTLMQAVPIIKYDEVVGAIVS